MDLLKELQAVSELCCLQHLNNYAYTAPDSIFYRGIPLYMSDIGMSFDSRHTLKGVEDPSVVPWDEDVKSLTSDLMTILNRSSFERYVFLTNAHYTYIDNMHKLLRHIPSINPHAYVICVSPIPEHNYAISITRGGSTPKEDLVPAEMLVSVMTKLCNDKDTLVCCHTAEDPWYLEVISSIPDCTWSMPSTQSLFLTSSTEPDRSMYMCQVFSHPASVECRAIGIGPPALLSQPCIKYYRSRMYYYSTCIRGAQAKTGRCFDCEVLYRLTLLLGVKPSQGVELLKNITLDKDFIASVYRSNT